MKVVSTKQDIRGLVRDWKKNGLKIGLVPTMGYFHQGHLSLMDISRRMAKKTVVSIFVNPTQFGPGEDFNSYPRDLERDLTLAEEQGVDAVFVPTDKEMYPHPLKTWVMVEGLTKYLCGASRPGHFKGVTTVVIKLFNLIQPDLAVFGQKDFQQLQVIKRMVKDLDLPIQIISGPIVREEDGLAMSSRNTYLSSSERESAICLFKALELAKELVTTGRVRNIKELETAIRRFIEGFPFTRIDYIFIGDPEELVPATGQICTPLLVALAVYVGRTRLIDNIVIE